MRTKRSERSSALPLARSGSVRRSSGRGGRSASASTPLVSGRGRHGQAGVAFGRRRHYVLAMRNGSNRPLKRLDELFAAEPDRLSRLSFEVAGLYFDWSKTHLDRRPIEQFARRARRQMGFAAARDALFAGEIVNPSEGRAATHVAERGSGAPEDVDLATARRQRMRALVDAIEAGAFGDVTGILHIGIGGSVLGPALLVDALGRQVVDAQRALPVEHRRRRVRRCGEAARSRRRRWSSSRRRPSRRSETLTNLEAARDWLRAAGVDDPDGRRHRGDRQARRRRSRQGIDETRILQFGEGVGGRYSLWSSVGVTAALALGWDAFEALLEGAAEMDRHFRFAEPAANVPLIAAFADRLYVEELGCQTRARLRL